MTALRKRITLKYRQIPPPILDDDILVILHQDIAFDTSEPWLRVQRELGENPRQIVGFAGMSKEVGRTISNVRDQGTKEFVTLTRVSEKTEVEALDECCFAITAGLFREIWFDAEVCDHWHLYAVNLCYEARLDHGARSYVLPESIYHKCTLPGRTLGGTQYSDRHFLRCLRRMVRRYRKRVPVIYTTCLICPTSFIGSNLRLYRSTLKNIISKH